MIYEKSIWKNQVSKFKYRSTDGKRHMKLKIAIYLIFTACVACKNRFPNWYLQAKNPDRRIWFSQLDFSKFKYRSTKGKRYMKLKIAIYLLVEQHDSSNNSRMQLISQKMVVKVFYWCKELWIYRLLLIQTLNRSNNIWRIH